MTLYLIAKAFAVLLIVIGLFCLVFNRTVQFLLDPKPNGSMFLNFIRMPLSMLFFVAGRTISLAMIVIGVLLWLALR